MKIAELFAELGFKTNSTEQMKLRDFAGALADLNMSSILAATGLGVAGETLWKFTKQVGEHSVHLDKMRVLTGRSTTEIQQWERAVEAAGGTAQDYDAMLMGIQKMMMDITMGGSTGNKAMQVFGIKPGEDISSQYEKIFRVLHTGINPNLKTWLSSQYGINENMQYVIQKMENISDVKKFPVLSLDTIKSATEEWSRFLKVIGDLGIAFEHLAASLGPELKLILAPLELISKYIENVSNFVELINATFAGKYTMRTGVYDASSEGVAPGSVNQTNHLVFNIQGGGDPQSVARSVADEVNKIIQQMRRSQRAQVT